jgi:hypothetical protein
MTNIVLMSLTKSNETETSNLYLQSLCHHLYSINIDTVYIFKSFDIELPLKIKKHQIIDISDNPESFLKDKKNIYVIKLMPVEVNNKGDIEIGLIDYILEKEGDELIMSNAGSEVFIYRYNKKAQKYKLIDRGLY